MFRFGFAPRHDAIPARHAATLWEAAVVLGLPVAIFLGPQLWPLLVAGEVVMRPAFSDTGLLRTLAFEVVLAALLLAWLSGRGWRLGSHVGAPTPGDLTRGVGLWVVLFVAGQLVRLALFILSPAVVTATQAAPLHGALSLWTLAAALVINPVFEEGLWLGYAIPTLERAAGLRVAVVVSVVLRVLVHFNQGVHALVSVLPVGLVFTASFRANTSAVACGGSARDQQRDRPWRFHQW